jgi:hypothetical protein
MPLACASGTFPRHRRAIVREVRFGELRSPNPARGSTRHVDRAPSLTLRSASASGTVATAIHIGTPERVGVSDERGRVPHLLSDPLDRLLTRLTPLRGRGATLRSGLDVGQAQRAWRALRLLRARAALFEEGIPITRN